MSEQADALNRALREKGVAPPEPPATAAEEPFKLEPSPLPPIELPREGRYLGTFAHEAGLIARTNGVFRREMTPVTINPETSMMEALTADRFRTYLEKIAFPFVWKATGKGKDARLIQAPTTVAVDAARGTLASDQFVLKQRRLAKINVVQQPVIREDGKIELLPIGYDEQSEIFTIANDVIIDSSWELDKAVTFFRDLHKEFPWADPRSLSVHIAAMVSFFGSSLQDLTDPRMNFVYDANSPGGGKGLLVKLVVIPVMGLCEVQTIPDSKEEFRKALDSAALSSVPYLFFDELEGNVKNNDLNAFMTTDYRVGRLMGGQQRFRCPKITVCFLAGNNLSLSADVARRTLISSLYVEESNIRDHKIDRVLSSKILAKKTTRGDILSALWALIRAWDKAGRPAASRTVPTFEEWASIFGGIVEYAGFGCPLDPPAADQSADTEADDMLALVKALSGRLGTRTADSDQVEKHLEYTFEDVIECCLELNAFAWIIDGKWKEEKEGKEVVDKWYECTPKAAAIMGKLFSGRFGGRVFRLEDGKRVRFGKRGKNRQRRYSVTLEE